jgi:hypothetical protein
MDTREVAVAALSGDGEGGLGADDLEMVESVRERVVRN